MTRTVEIVRQFQTLANEFFFTISPYTLNDCISAFSRLAGGLSTPDFLQILTKCQALLLIDQIDTETLANALID